MIDFKLNEYGDMELEENKALYPQFKINFSASENYPKLRINFYTKSNCLKKEGLRINFDVENTKEQELGLAVPCVRRDTEKGQSMAIRLKTELNEIQNFFSDFGSNLILMRHEDLLDEGNYELIVQYVKEAVADIIGTDDYEIEVRRENSNIGNFKIENLNISICNTSGTVEYVYTI